MLTKTQLAQMIKGNKYVDNWYDALSILLPEYDIDSPKRIAAFIAQCAHESTHRGVPFAALEENLNYSAQGLRKTFGKYFPTDELAKAYERKPEKIANRVYANRYGNGPESSGDGWTHRGQGLIQLTFYDNYRDFGESLDPTLSPKEVSEYLKTFEGASQSACWFWEKSNLNRFADKGDIRGMTRVINGGENGLADREKHYAHNLHIMGV
jgi:putative chitinase